MNITDIDDKVYTRSDVCVPREVECVCVHVQIIRRARRTHLLDSYGRDQPSKTSIISDVTSAMKVCS